MFAGYNPVKELENLTRMFFDDSAKGYEYKNKLTPRVDVFEKGEDIVIEAEISGLDKNDIKVTTEKNMLVIEGEKKKPAGENVTWSERIYGKFRRSFTLPEDTDVSKTEAEYKNGILTVTLKKSEEAKNKIKEISVK